MKTLYFNLKEAKRTRIFDAACQEFADQDYENASLDRIVEAAGISKGGLYEYIESKDDLYLHVVEQVYGRLYGHLASVALPGDILDRFRAVSGAAIDFYLEHPRCIAIIVRSGHLSDPDLAGRVGAVFEGHFSHLFDSVTQDGLRFPRQRLIDLMKWLLAKTRTDFLAEQAAGSDQATVRERYLEEWDFLLSVLKSGIYVNNYGR